MSAPSPTVSLSLVILVAVSLVLGVTLVIFAQLRETPEFWLNSGGFPIPLRHFVKDTYWALMVVDGSVLVLLSLLSLAGLRMPAFFVAVEFLVIAAGWVLFGTSFFISSKNNLANLWNERPVHYKPTKTRP